jgi:hypothetical protein
MAQLSLFVPRLPKVERWNSRQQYRQAYQGVLRVFVDRIDYYQPTDSNKQRRG